MAKNEGVAEATKIGFIYTSLDRTNKQIRRERGDAIAESLEMIYKREVEDLQMSLKILNRDRLNMFDFSPENSQSLVMAKDLESPDIKNKDLDISLKIRNIEIKLEIASSRYEFLFGKTV